MDEETFNMVAQKRIVYQVPGMERVKVPRDITYIFATGNWISVT